MQWNFINRKNTCHWDFFFLFFFNSSSALSIPWWLKLGEMSFCHITKGCRSIQTGLNHQSTHYHLWQCRNRESILENVESSKMKFQWCLVTVSPGSSFCGAFLLVSCIYLLHYWGWFHISTTVAVCWQQHRLTVTDVIRLCTQFFLHVSLLLFTWCTLKVITAI